MKTAALILNYNSAQETMALSDTLTDLVSHILVVDNASGINDREQLALYVEKYSDISLIQLEKNVGYARGNNVGLTQLDQMGFTHVLVSNPDVTIFDESVVEKIFDCFRCSATLVSASCLINDLSPYMVRPDILAMLVPPLNRIRDRNLFRATLRELPTANEKIKVYKQYGCFVAFDLALFRALNFFSPSTFLYFEESLVAERCLEKNLSQVVITSGGIQHRTQGAVSNLGFRQYKYFLHGCYIYWSEGRGASCIIAGFAAAIDVVWRIMMNSIYRVGR